MSSNIRPVILCGGSGTRLWPLSRESFPKQFVPLIKGQSLMALTLARIQSLGIPICVTNEEYRFFVEEALTASAHHGRRTPSILLEPVGRNTAAAMASAASMPDVKDSDLLLFLPADHFVPDVTAFIATMQSGVVAAQAGYIVTFGVSPIFPSTAYGYIQQGPALKLESQSADFYAVQSFVEKPPVNQAQEMLLSGDYFWNAGIFLCQVAVLKKALKQHASDILELCEKAMQLADIDGDFVRPDRDTFLRCRSESIDCAIMEHFDQVAVIPFKGAWSDVGSWNAVSSLSSADESGNRIHGQGQAWGSSNTYINAPHRPVVALGTTNLIVVDTPDAVLVAAADQVEQVKEVVAKLKEQGASQAVTHRRVPRPWGWYDSLDLGQRFQVKRISVKPGGALSLQLHRHRAEHWIVVKGLARVTNGGQTFILEENQSTYIPIGSKHRLENPGNNDLEMIEVQSGEYLGEDDILRFEDSYGRT